MENEIIEVKQAEVLQAINRSEVDIQIATAKQYPRELNQVLNRIKTYATVDEETAEDCFYAIRRGRGNDAALIEGISVRLAEIIAGAWGNLRIATRIIGNDGKTITAQAVCQDLETNVAVSLTVPRSITYKNGATYSEDMQVVTGNAAAAIAFRNAVLKIVPKAVTKKVVDEIKQVALGKSIGLEERRQRMMQYFQTIGVTQAELFTYLGVKAIEQIDSDMVFTLRGLANAIKEGTTTVAETFKGHTAKTEEIAAKAKAEAKKKHDRVAEAMAASKSQAAKKEQTSSEPTPTPDADPETETAPEAEPTPTTAVDPETGEVIDVTEE